MTLRESLTSFLNKICQPNLKQLKDTSEFESLRDKNKLLLLVFTFLAIAPLGSILGGTLPSELAKIILFCGITNLGAFLICCRSYLTLFHVYLTVQIGLFPFFSLRAAPEMAFMHFGNIIMHPALVLIVTNNIYLVGIAGVAEIIASQTIFKEVIRENLLFLDENTFTEKLVETSVSVIVSMLILFVIVFWRLNKINKELASTKKLAEDRLEQQKTFVFSFSHELRNPLNSLLGNLQLALMGTLPPESKETVKTAQMCAELLLQLINNVLDIGKFELGKLEVNPTPTRVYDCFERIWAISSDLISRKNLKSHIKIEKKVPLVLLLDSHRINQMMMNMIGNALKFTDRGSISISIKWLEGAVLNDNCFEPKPYDTESEGLFEKEEGLYLLSMGLQKHKSKEHILLTKSQKEISYNENSFISSQESSGILKIAITDTGCGISQKGLDALFQKFSQVSDDPGKRQIGTGLGLFITKEICRAMKGDVRAYSKEGTGTTFIICIPSRSVVSQMHPHLQKSPSSMISFITQKKLKAVVADDSPFNVRMVSDFFARLGIQVVKTAGDGLEAYQKYKECRDSREMIDIVTLDIDMPRMDGKIACQKIREYERHIRLDPTLVILISGNYDVQQVNNYLDARGEKRADFFLKKPVEFDEFCSTVYRLIHKRGDLRSSL